ncbi:hypothetical protein [Mycobacteroides abscessus]|uniref:hypothetical protein n=1 Tax=Mycobacteroides abscessus TaxID=36809 RepID=UPI0009266E1D|nr:hypothetical protein [Mycobacteroides abscessus]SHP98984.1 Uncharacterised protein [Mycobacteroides abscessus subsp. abscessus]SHQ61569.1 Uncharacterised protein [Mycobacteroides abscessus subsp. abscessus]SKD62889.1 Uncharacterised protein [Mycobacteroides abscessus subsp. abscessus]SLD63259.1 Uncharacterised protein [Mycobacteroides abscessus subsp. abscessus]
MSGDIYNQTEDQRVMTAALNTAADEWESIAAEAAKVTETPSAERTAWQGVYSPKGAHAAKMAELSTGTAGLATQARSIAARLRQAASSVLTNATTVDENNSAADESFNSVDTDISGEGKYEI